jgi:hypothetical protein
MFLRGPCRVVILKTIGATEWVVSSVEFCTGGCEERIWAREAEDSQLLEAVIRERLVKTQQAGKCLAGAVVICELWRLAVALYLFVDPGRVYK